MKVTIGFMAVLLMFAGLVFARTPDGVVRVERDPESFTTSISIEATEGRVAWADVARGLARARGYDDSAIEDVLPGGSFDITKTRSRLLLAGLNLALSPNVSFAVEKDLTEREQRRLVIELDQAALMSSQRRFKAMLRNALTSRRGDNKANHGLKFDDDWHRAAANNKLVVFVHGLHSDPQAADYLLGQVRRAGFPCAVFSYPNDQPIADSAEMLSSELKKLAEEHPDREIALLTHSMGGLIARAVIEDPESDPGNVRQLIMVAPPNHGSALAKFAFGVELWEHARDEVRQRKVHDFFAMVEDGLAEAARDLRPDSPFLKTLNSRQRNPKVRYTMLLGSGGPLSEAELDAMRNATAAAGDKSRWVRFFRNRAVELLDDLDEVVEGKGDGVVSVERSRLDSVSDTIVLDFGHVRVLKSPKSDGTREAHRVILQRLGGNQKGKPGARSRAAG